MTRPDPTRSLLATAFLVGLALAPVVNAFLP